MENHQRGPSRYFCSYNISKCAYSSINQKELEAHINKHHKDDPNPYHCDLCESSYTTNSNLKTHIRQIHLKPLEQTNQICRYCGKKFKVNDNPKLLQNHEKLHAKSRSNCNNNLHVCVILKCKEVFPSSIALKNHVRLVHEQNTSKCTKCNLVYANPKSLKRHIKDTHCERNPALKCKECSYIGRLPSDILLHMNKHSDEKKFKCNLCDAAYKNKCSLGFHMKKHRSDDEKKHKCARCPKSFSQASLLRKHEETHCTIKFYSCEMCGTRFKQSSNLKYHEKYKCKRRKSLCTKSKDEFGIELFPKSRNETMDKNQSIISTETEDNLYGELDISSTTSLTVENDNLGLLRQEDAFCVDNLDELWINPVELEEELGFEVFNFFNEINEEDCSISLIQTF